MFSFNLIFIYASILFPDTTCIDSNQYKKNIDSALSSFSIVDSIKGDIFYESCDMVSIGNDIYNREQFLNSRAAQSFVKMKNHAKRDSVDLQFVSAFRSFDYQKKIIQRKLKRGDSIKKILRENKLPGYSEHHTGKAIDITSKELNGLSVSFEDTKEFAWLVKNASIYNFYLSYPKDNKEGIMYEPWHWMFKNND
tara:strand:+ start:351 stop:935 length:585 start_codon:yes stop_codon:yes gene_type:complete